MWKHSEAQRRESGADVPAGVGTCVVILQKHKPYPFARAALLKASSQLPVNLTVPVTVDGASRLQPVRE